MSSPLGLGQGDAAFFVIAGPACRGFVHSSGRPAPAPASGPSSKLVDERVVHEFCWIVDFPMFEWDGRREACVDFSTQSLLHATGRAWRPWRGHRSAGPSSAYQYDIVCNGYRVVARAPFGTTRPEIMLQGLRDRRATDASVKSRIASSAECSERLPLRRPAARRPGPRHRPHRHAASGRTKHPRGHRLPHEPECAGSAHGRAERGVARAVAGPAHSDSRVKAPMRMSPAFSALRFSHRLQKNSRTIATVKRPFEFRLISR